VHIISASRKTDIPTFYMEWFMNRIKEGKAYAINPFNKKAKEVSLKQEDVAAIVFWSKNYRPAMKKLIELKNLGYNLFFHYTITGQGRSTERFVSPLEVNINTFQWLAEQFSKEQLIWRFDPIFYTTNKQQTYYLETFELICQQLKGYTHSCYMSFVTYYPKVQKSIKRELHDEFPIEINEDEQINLLTKMVEIANKYDMQLYSCCQNHLTAVDGVKKGSCINFPYLKKLFHLDLELEQNPTREQCGCYKSYDIGFYNSCPHGCVYCYANISHRSALKNYQSHDASSKFILNDQGIKIETQQL